MSCDSDDCLKLKQEKRINIQDCVISGKKLPATAAVSHDVLSVDLDSETGDDDAAAERSYKTSLLWIWVLERLPMFCRFRITYERYKDPHRKEKYHQSSIMR
jgi:hypothetical protein